MQVRPLNASVKFGAALRAIRCTLWFSDGPAVARAATAGASEYSAAPSVQHPLTDSLLPSWMRSDQLWGELALIMAFKPCADIVTSVLASGESSAVRIGAPTTVIQQPGKYIDYICPDLSLSPEFTDTGRSFPAINFVGSILADACGIMLEGLRLANEAAGVDRPTREQIRDLFTFLFMSLPERTALAIGTSMRRALCGFVYNDADAYDAHFDSSVGKWVVAPVYSDAFLSFYNSLTSAGRTVWDTILPDLAVYGLVMEVSQKDKFLTSPEGVVVESPTPDSIIEWINKGGDPSQIEVEDPQGHPGFPNATSGKSERVNGGGGPGYDEGSMKVTPVPDSVIVDAINDPDSSTDFLGLWQPPKVTNTPPAGCALLEANDNPQSVCRLVGYASQVEPTDLKDFRPNTPTLRARWAHALAKVCFKIGKQKGYSYKATKGSGANSIDLPKFKGEYRKLAASAARDSIDKCYQGVVRVFEGAIIPLPEKADGRKYLIVRSFGELGAQTIGEVEYPLSFGELWPEEMFMSGGASLEALCGPVIHGCWACDSGLLGKNSIDVNQTLFCTSSVVPNPVSHTEESAYLTYGAYSSFLETEWKHCFENYEARATALPDPKDGGYGPGFNWLLLLLLIPVIGLIIGAGCGLTDDGNNVTKEN